MQIHGKMIACLLSYFTGHKPYPLSIFLIDNADSPTNSFCPIIKLSGMKKRRLMRRFFVRGVSGYGFLCDFGRHDRRVRCAHLDCGDRDGGCRSGGDGNPSHDSGETGVPSVEPAGNAVETGSAVKTGNGVETTGNTLEKAGNAWAPSNIALAEHSNGSGPGSKTRLRSSPDSARYRHQNGSSSILHRRARTQKETNPVQQSE